MRRVACVRVTPPRESGRLLMLETEPGHQTRSVRPLGLTAALLGGESDRRKPCTLLILQVRWELDVSHQMPANGRLMVS